LRAVHYLRALGFPTIAWVVTYVLIAVTIKLFPDLVVRDGIAIGTAFLVLVGWSLGAWAGYSIVEFGGKFIDVMLVSAIIAALAGVLQIIIVGVLVSFPAPVDVNGQLPVAVFNLMPTLGGALTAGGFALTK
jgi:hypothetical protein